MVDWTCPNCKESMYSAATFSDQDKVICIHCSAAIDNKYFEGGSEDE